MPSIWIDLHEAPGKTSKKKPTIVDRLFRL